MKITKRLVDKLGPGAFAWDNGFGVKATDGGAKVYVVSYRTGRRKRRYTIGRHGAPWTPDSARKEANRLLALVAAGVDPMAAKATARGAATVRELTERFMTEHVAAKRKPSTARLYRGLLDRIILPALGGRTITDVTRADVAALHHRRRATPIDANRALLLVSKLMNFAERLGLRPDGSNPARHVERFRERRRERYLTTAEFQRLGDALATAAVGVALPGHAEPAALSPTALAAIKLLIFTGARRGEILSLRWEHVDLEHGCLRLPDSKTGAKLVMLNAPAAAVLAGLPHVEKNPYVLPGVRRGQHLVNVTETWHIVRDLAGLKDVRLHDLRHSHASVGAEAGLSLPMIGALLGHTQAQTTKRYAHLAADPVKAASELVGSRIAAAMGGGR
jgi:integrase